MLLWKVLGAIIAKHELKSPSVFPESMNTHTVSKRAVAVVKSIKDGGEKIPTPILALSTVVCCGAWRGRVRRINCDAVTLIRLRNMWFHDNDMMEQRSTACYNS